LERIKEPSPLRSSKIKYLPLEIHHLAPSGLALLCIVLCCVNIICDSCAEGLPERRVVVEDEETVVVLSEAVLDEDEAELVEH